MAGETDIDEYLILANIEAAARKAANNMLGPYSCEADEKAATVMEFFANELAAFNKRRRK